MSVEDDATSMKVWADFLEPLMKFKHRCNAKIPHTALNNFEREVNVSDEITGSYVE
jgi:hypothetical protein